MMTVEELNKKLMEYEKETGRPAKFLYINPNTWRKLRRRLPHIKGSNTGYELYAVDVIPHIGCKKDELLLSKYDFRI